MKTAELICLAAEVPISHPEDPMQVWFANRSMDFCQQWNKRMSGSELFEVIETSSLWHLPQLETTDNIHRRHLIFEVNNLEIDYTGEVLSVLDRKVFEEIMKLNAESIGITCAVNWADLACRVFASFGFMGFIQTKKFALMGSIERIKRSAIQIMFLQDSEICEKPFYITEYECLVHLINRYSLNGTGELEFEIDPLARLFFNPDSYHEFQNHREAA